VDDISEYLCEIEANFESVLELLSGTKEEPTAKKLRVKNLMRLSL
jgi:hypothetical protein